MTVILDNPGFLANVLPANDDGSTSAAIPFGFPNPINFYGNDYTGAWVNNNGNITFTSAQYTYTPYGLAGAVWSADTDKAVEIARRMETGTVWVNQNLNLRPDTPFGGHKQSGHGVENGMEGLLEYMSPQSVYVAKQPVLA